jgi:hypothetical protein
MGKPGVAGPAGAAGKDGEDGKVVSSDELLTFLFRVVWDGTAVCLRVHVEAIRHRSACLVELRMAHDGV